MRLYKNIQENSDLLLLLIIIIAFIVLKVPFLSLPYYWDEAWSYKPAIEEMVKNGPSLLPNSISVDYYKGHPLFFYFITSLFLKIFGNTIFISKLFALIISLLVMVSIFFLSKLLTKNKIVAIFSTLILMSQSIFIAQSTLVLPEMLLALLTLLSLFYFFKKQKIPFVIFTSLLLLTKETGIVLYASLFIGSIISDFKLIKKNLFKYIITNSYLFIPIIPVLIFFILQKIVVGWFFYPEHIGYVEFGKAFTDKFIGYISYLFIYQGRNIITSFILLALLFIFAKKEKLKIKSELTILFVFIFMYIIFSSLNFYATRYTLSLIPILIIITVYYTNKAFDKEFIKYLFFLIMIGSSVIYSITHQKDNDHSTGYENAIFVQQKMILFCQEEDYYEKNIATHFLMRINLTDSIMGYLNSSKTFSNIQDSINIETEFAIISSNEKNEKVEKFIKENNCVLIKEFDKEQSWCKIYKIR